MAILGCTTVDILIQKSAHPHLAGLICHRSEMKIYFFKSEGQLKFCLRLNQLPQLLQPGSFESFRSENVGKTPSTESIFYDFSQTAMTCGINHDKSLINPPFSDPASATAGPFVAEPSIRRPPKSRSDMTRSPHSQEAAERIRWGPGTPDVGPGWWQGLHLKIRRWSKKRGGDLRCNRCFFLCRNDGCCWRN